MKHSSLFKLQLEMIIVFIPFTIYHNAKANKCSQILLIKKEKKLIIILLILIVILTLLQLGVYIYLKISKPYKILPTMNLRGCYYLIWQYHAIRILIAHLSKCINRAIHCITSVVYQTILLLNVILIYHYPKPSQRTYGIFINIQYLIMNQIFLSQTTFKVVKGFLEISNI